MVRARNTVASRKRRKRLLKRAKGFSGDRKNHVRLSSDAVMKALAFSTMHRKKKKGDFRRLWITRIGVAAKAQGISYSRLINGLTKAGCQINRKMLSDIAIRDPQSFAAFADTAKQALAS
ncbi:50S ribosomal protein L20 [Candidatus Neptunochlamydia vexilliferae]|uniref:Large ribosomal subunit protein bL20 n=1 Tax=Candidatus Neptunichlamydia vexilliferae TaxID=1651774 RepID=A0ABS0AX11_9BACT|nr:50S ribosomal protein L20 [Candidatus Neptunochlamydia vexilliferae]MBF5058677.1 50S ribosomal protein L20 [Candidatus Neptunochlamydia vexilliferae]